MILQRVTDSRFCPKASDVFVTDIASLEEKLTALKADLKAKKAELKKLDTELGKLEEQKASFDAAEAEKANEIRKLTCQNNSAKV